MRRKEREITDPALIEEIIAGCDCMHLGLNDNGKVYVVPVNYGYEIVDGRYVFYFHGAKEGRKYEVMKNSPEVGFEMERNVSIRGEGNGCSYTALYQSVIGNGTISFPEGDAKTAALEKLMKQTTGRDGWNFDPEVFERTCVFRLEADELTCKANQ